MKHKKRTIQRRVANGETLSEIFDEYTQQLSSDSFKDRLLKKKIAIWIKYTPLPETKERFQKAINYFRIICLALIPLLMYLDTGEIIRYGLTELPYGIPLFVLLLNYFFSICFLFSFISSYSNNLKIYRVTAWIAILNLLKEVTLFLNLNIFDTTISIVAIVLLSSIAVLSIYLHYKMQNKFKRSYETVDNRKQFKIFFNE